MRTYDEAVIVHLRSAPGLGGSGDGAGDSNGDPDGPVGVGEPEGFVWRGRSYRVEAVLDRWVRRRPWWRLALDPVPAQHWAHAGAERAAQSADATVMEAATDAATTAQAAQAAQAALADLEEDVWRVEATRARVRPVAALRSGGGSGEQGGAAEVISGVYDLVDLGPARPAGRAGRTEADGPAGRWRLIGVAD